MTVVAVITAILTTNLEVKIQVDSLIIVGKRHRLTIANKNLPFQHLLIQSQRIIPGAQEDTITPTGTFPTRKTLHRQPHLELVMASIHRHQEVTKDIQIASTTTPEEILMTSWE